MKESIYDQRKKKKYKGKYKIGGHLRTIKIKKGKIKKGGSS